MNRTVNTVSGRLSLRAPQRDSLEILARIAEILTLKKGEETAWALEIVRSEYPSVTDFEREFPSLCFALATGVGKTRLMGAFIAYLALTGRSRHFFVLAPNLTIYNKLIADFSPGTPKYVFQGIAEFASDPPILVTGDNYETGKGVRKSSLFQDAVHVNIFNISKFNTEARGGGSLKMKRLSEYIGTSYFQYLSELDDLVLLMDESHRYRGTAGVRALNELKPILGLELTATPQTEAPGGPIKFKNVIYSYPLANALTDGFVKDPAVATRENFKKEDYTEEQLERLKLEDGIHVHENTKVELENYSRSSNERRVKPFMLVVAQDTDHANRLLAILKGDDFFEGGYRDKVITVHSNQRGEEKDETVAQLMAVENPDNRTEIVIHVNMLREGWDVTNLYTIVPLRAANSRTLVEQSLGRGLRLPYGKRTGIPAVDRLTIVAHDRFQELVDDANRPDSIIRTGVVIGRDIPLERQLAVTVPTVLDTFLEGGGEETGKLADAAPECAEASHLVYPMRPGSQDQPTLPVFTPAERQVARTALSVISARFERLPSLDRLKEPEIQAQIVRVVEQEMRAGTEGQTVLYEVDGAPNIADVVRETTALFVDRTIAIPRLTVVPTGDVTCGFSDFDLDASGIFLQPVSQEILLQHLHSNVRYRLNRTENGTGESRPEDILVSALMDYNDVCYDEQAALLYKLSGQMVARLRAYLTDDGDVRNVLQYHQRTLADAIHTQMQGHFWQKATGYEAKVSKGFITLRPANYTSSENEAFRDFRRPVDDRQAIRRMLFGGFHRCLYPRQKFDSDAERRFAVILEDDSDSALKWFKPAREQLRIDYAHGENYEPDFVVETTGEKLLCEVKRSDEIGSPAVIAKASAAVTWCHHASEHERLHGGKPWRYLLIPHSAVSATATLAGLCASHTLR